MGTVVFVIVASADTRTRQSQVKTPSLFSAFAALLRPGVHASLTHRATKYQREFPERIMPLTEEVLKKVGA